MNPRPEYLRLCRLLDETIRPFSDLAADSLSEEAEKDVLIALSEVFKQVKQWTNELDSDEELPSEPDDDTEYPVAQHSHFDNHHCLAKIVGDLMFLLSFNSRYTQHLAGNTLLAISEFVVTSDCAWNEFLHLLCISLELAICNCAASSSAPGALETRYLDNDPSTSKSLLNPKLKSANWFVVAAIFRVLHNIQKYLKQPFDDKLMKAYLDSVSSLMLNLHWAILSKMYIGQYVEALKGSAKEVSHQRKVVQPREITLFLGNFIRFLCSVVVQCSFLEDGGCFSPIISKIINLVPKLTAWCHAELQSPHDVRISHYFRHKVLMLMVKLSSSIHIEQSILKTWIHLVQKYFADLLVQPIYGVKFDHDGSLEGSPFCTSIFDPGKQNMLSRHLQRQTVFLFLKCSLNLVSIKGSPDEQQWAYENLKHYCTADPNLDSECHGESIGLIELHKWLQAHVPADILVNNELYFEQCVRFTSSFLQLFMHEDDTLFEILLQIFRVPYYHERQITKDEPLAKVKNDLVFLVSDLFNPIHLFHLFLAEIHYDHQVLLDYLISKDTGSSCAEYLLRSLRTVCNSWSLFVEFPGVEECLYQLCPKRQKVLVDSVDFEGVLSPASLKKGGISSLVKEQNEAHEHGRECCRNYNIPFVAARDCLVSLTTSINNLNQKKLFPYNPQVLLRRLMRFQELCNEQ